MIAKELRALLPVWAASVAAMAACGLFRALYPFVLPAYFFASAALGAMAFGHEYTHRTVPLMLTLPVSRRRILLTKLVVLAAALLLLAAVATTVVPFWREARFFPRTVMWLPFFAGLLITPYLTIVTRSPLGGAVFTLGLSGMLLVAGEWIGISKYGYSREVDDFRVAFVWYALVVLSAGGGIALWRTFGRLQSLDGGDDAIDLTPGTAGTSHALRRQNPIWLLIKKELRLQQLSFAVAALYVVTFTSLSVQDAALLPAGLIPVLYAWILAVLIGATASAEERHLRTLDAQLLLPMPASRQWLIKIGVVIALSLVLAILLPAGLAAALTTSHITRSILQMLLLSKFVLLLLGVTVVSLYVSTLCSSGIWALMISVPTALAAAAAVVPLGDQLQHYLYSLGGRPDWRLIERLTLLLTLALFGIVLRLAFVNHRSADRSAARTASQIAIAAGSVVLAAAILAVTGSLTR